MARIKLTVKVAPGVVLTQEDAAGLQEQYNALVRAQGRPDLVASEMKISAPLRRVFGLPARMVWEVVGGVVLAGLEAWLVVASAPGVALASELATRCGVDGGVATGILTLTTAGVCGGALMGLRRLLRPWRRI